MSAEANNLRARRCPNGNRCFCSVSRPNFSHAGNPDENFVFYDIRRLLRGPADGSDFRFPFYFHVLDGFRNEAISLGYRPTKINYTAASIFEEKVRNLASQRLKNASGGQIDVRDIIADLARSDFPVDYLTSTSESYSGARSYAALQGQPLSNTPSRMEQCLTIQWAREVRLFKPSGDLLVDHDLNLYAVEDYLGTCKILDDDYERAIQRIGLPFDRHEKGAICTPKTAPFLVSEHLEFMDRTNPNLDDIAERLDKPHGRLGLAILPFKILGQYRAAGVWLFRGEYRGRHNYKLRRYLSTIGQSWTMLPTTVGQLLLNASQIQLFAALSSVREFAEGDLLNCLQARRALQSLWFSANLKFVRDKKEIKIKSLNLMDAPRSWPLPLETINLPYTDDKFVAQLLGFDTVQFDCPLVEPQQFEHDTGHVRRMFQKLNDEALVAFGRTQHSIQKKLELGGHEVTNSLNDLVSLATCNTVAADGLLQLTRRQLEQLRGSAWVTRMITKGEALEVSFDTKPPSQADFEDWRCYVYEQSIFVAAAALLRDRGPMVLRFVFDFGERAKRWRSEEVVSMETLPRLLARWSNRRPQWPLKSVDSSRTRLEEDGWCSIMLWGAIELIRNACNVVAREPIGDSGDRTINISATCERADCGWRVRVTIDNAWSGKVQEIEGFSWYEMMRRIMPHIHFERVTTPGRAIYRYTLETRS